MIDDDLKMTNDADVLVAINLVIGNLHETEEVIDETLEGIKAKAHLVDTFENINALVLIPEIVYWEQPEKLVVSFVDDQKKFYQKNPKHITHHLWYSVKPYIDQDIRPDPLALVMLGAMHARIRVTSAAEWTAKSATGS